MNEWKDERVEGRTDGRTNGRIDEGTDGRKNRWKDERMEGRTDGRTNGRIDEQTDGRTGKYDEGNSRFFTSFANVHKNTTLHYNNLPIIGVTLMKFQQSTLATNAKDSIYINM